MIEVARENRAHRERAFRRIAQEHSDPRPLWDTVLFRTSDVVVVPTLGAIIPNWLLVVPREPALNFAKWSVRTGQNPVAVLRDALGVARTSVERVIWFEHGPAEPRTEASCGTDYAHIHAIVDPPFTAQEFSEALSKLSKFQTTTAREVYACLPDSAPYLVFGSGEWATYAQPDGPGQSQFFRRTVARLVGRPDEWDYRLHPHLDNVALTVGSLSLGARA